MIASGSSRVLAVSPHLADAVLSAGSFGARHLGAVVVTFSRNTGSPVPCRDQPLNQYSPSTQMTDVVVYRIWPR